jgi:hypothetical protein
MGERHMPQVNYEQHMPQVNYEQHMPQVVDVPAVNRSVPKNVEPVQPAEPANFTFGNSIQFGKSSQPQTKEVDTHALSQTSTQTPMHVKEPVQVPTLSPPKSVNAPVFTSPRLANTPQLAAPPVPFPNAKPVSSRQRK